MKSTLGSKEIKEPGRGSRLASRESDPGTCDSSRSPSLRTGRGGGRSKILSKKKASMSSRSANRLLRVKTVKVEGLLRLPKHGRIGNEMSILGPELRSSYEKVMGRGGGKGKGSKSA